MKKRIEVIYMKRFRNIFEGLEICVTKNNTWYKEQKNGNKIKVKC